jgi:type II secretory pathway predicted ATPase ExeA
MTSLAKAFLEHRANKNYIHLGPHQNLIALLQQTIQDPIKFVLVYGKSGTGKTVLTHYLASILKNERNVVYFDTPYEDSQLFFTKISQELYPTLSTPLTSYNTLIAHMLQHPIKQLPLIIIDETKYFSVKILEKIRLLADQNLFNFILITNRKEEAVLQNEQLFPRIWKMFNVPLLSKEDIQTYIYEKLSTHGYETLQKEFTPSIMMAIEEKTRGNLRQVNALLFSLFEHNDQADAIALHHIDTQQTKPRYQPKREEIAPTPTVKKTVSEPIIVQPMQKASIPYAHISIALLVLLLLVLGTIYVSSMNKTTTIIQQKPQTITPIQTPIEPEPMVETKPVVKPESIIEPPTNVEPKPITIVTIPLYNDFEQTPDLTIIEGTQPNKQIQRLEEKFTKVPSVKLGLFITNYYLAQEQYTKAYEVIHKTNHIEPSNRQTWELAAKILRHANKEIEANNIIMLYEKSYE